MTRLQSIAGGFIGALAMQLFAVHALAQEFPANVLPLTAWKLTLPINTARPGNPDEVLQPELNTFVDQKLFRVQKSAGELAVWLAAPCGGIPTSGSDYPRTELREMEQGGKRKASWGIADGGTHTLTARLAVTQAPQVKPQVICAQIHNEHDKLLAIRFENGRIIAEGEGQKDTRIVSSYELGTPFSLQIIARAGEIVVLYDHREVVRWNSNATGCYFKLGCYTQSNTARGDSAEAMGEVAVYTLNVEHVK